MNHGSLFSGIGGFDLAAEWMGWNNIFQVENDSFCNKILAKNFPDTLRFGDIVEFNKMLKDGQIITDTRLFGSEECEKQTKRTVKYNKGKYKLPAIDIITGGFPCQPFSQAGKRKGTDDSRYLWPEMLTTIRTLKPSYVVGENVAGLVSMENGKTLDGIFSDLENEGYEIESFIIPACSVGAWHRRDRIWIIAYNKSTGEWNEVGKYGRQRRKHTEGIQSEMVQQKDRQAQDNTITGGNQDVPDTTGIYAQGQYNRQRKIKSWGSDWWKTESSVGRVAHGIPDRVDRLKGLGNAIVPKVAFEIFKAIEKI